MYAAGCLQHDITALTGKATYLMFHRKRICLYWGLSRQIQTNERDGPDVALSQDVRPNSIGSPTENLIDKILKLSQFYYAQHDNTPKRNLYYNVLDKLHMIWEIQHDMWQKWDNNLQVKWEPGRSKKIRTSSQKKSFSIAPDNKL